jgi:hypothetical protein
VESGRCGGPITSEGIYKKIEPLGSTISAEGHCNERCLSQAPESVPFSG